MHLKEFLGTVPKKRPKNKRVAFGGGVMYMGKLGIFRSMPMRQKSVKLKRFFSLLPRKLY